MLTFNLKKEWFDKIKSGEKTHEYREEKSYWNRRIFNELLDRAEIENKVINASENLDNVYCFFVCGYAKSNDKNKRLLAKIKSIKIINGKNTDLKIDKPVYDIEFELIN